MSMLYLGLFLWLISVLLEFEFCVPASNQRGAADLWHSIGIRFARRDGIDFGASVGKMTGMFWMFTHLLTENILNIELGGIATMLIFFVPAWLGAAAWKNNSAVTGNG